MPHFALKIQNVTFLVQIPTKIYVCLGLLCLSVVFPLVLLKCLKLYFVFPRTTMRKNILGFTRFHLLCVVAKFPKHNGHTLYLYWSRPATLSVYIFGLMALKLINLSE